MDFNTLYQNNPGLAVDGILRNELDDGIISGRIPVGDAQPNEFITSFIGGPYLPDNSSFDPNTLSGLTFGGGGNYPKPFLSFSQNATNGNYSYIGPYARLVKFVESTCLDDNNDCGHSYELYGRLGVIPDGLGAGQYGFFYQPWYNFNDGQYGPEFWSERYNLYPPVPTKSDWWHQCSKTTILARFYNHPSRPWAKVEIAYQYLNFDSDQYFKGPDVRGLGDASLELLVVMTALAVAVRWL